jgi:hypothetical protein
MNSEITAEAVAMFSRTSSRSMANLPAAGGFQFCPRCNGTNRRRLPLAQLPVTTNGWLGRFVPDPGSGVP